MYRDGADSPSRWRPPAHAAYQAATAPNNPAALAMKARITLLRRPRAILSLAFESAISTRRSASPGARPVRAATNRMRSARSSTLTPPWLEDVNNIRAAYALCSPRRCLDRGARHVKVDRYRTRRYFLPLLRLLRHLPPEGAANRVLTEAARASISPVRSVAIAQTSKPCAPSRVSTSSADQSR